MDDAIEFSGIISHSSQTSQYPAENLVDYSKKQKWQVPAGETSGYVELSFSEPSKIAAIDLGNAGAAFVDVEVGHQNAPKQWFSLLSTQKFMNALDARNGVGVKKVLLMVYDSFHKANRDQEWDKLRVNVQQPFVKGRPFGLNFIVCRKEIPSSRMVNQQNIIRQRELNELKKLKEEKIAAQEKKKDSSEFDGNDFLDRSYDVIDNRSIKMPKDTSKENKSLKHSISHLKAASQTPSTSKHLKIASSLLPTASPASPTLKKIVAKSTSTPGTSQTPLKRKVVDPVKGRTPAKKPKVENTLSSVEFKRIMEGIIIAISGYVNPERGNIRQAAIDMGAQFERDVTPKVTHLICAVKNTPKYNQFLGRGKIMKKEWVFAQKQERTKIHWKKYSLAPVSEGSESEGEPEIETADEWTSGSEEDESTDPVIEDDEENLRINRQPSQIRKETSKVSSEIIRNDITVTLSMKKESSHVLSDYELDSNQNERELLFAPMVFMVDQSIPNRKELVSSIRENGGKVKKTLLPNVSHIICTSMEFQKSNKRIVFAKPTWVVDCLNHKRLLSPFAANYTVSQ